MDTQSTDTATDRGDNSDSSQTRCSTLPLELIKSQGACTALIREIDARIHTITRNTFSSYKVQSHLSGVAKKLEEVRDNCMEIAELLKELRKLDGKSS